jgi:sugar phosphate isomerase/epimerase
LFEYISFFASASRLRHAWQVVQEAGDPDAALVLDAFHTYNGGDTLDDLRAVPIERILHYHIDDADPRKPLGTQTDPDRVMPGDGCLDLKSEIRLLKEKGYDGAVSLELFNRALWQEDPGEVLKRGMERVRALVE